MRASDDFALGQRARLGTCCKDRIDDALMHENMEARVFRVELRAQVPSSGRASWFFYFSTEPSRTTNQFEIKPTCSSKTHTSLLPERDAKGVSNAMSSAAPQSSPPEPDASSEPDYDDYRRRCAEKLDEYIANQEHQDPQEEDAVDAFQQLFEMLCARRTHGRRAGVDYWQGAVPPRR